jgi:superoxide oxidase
MLNQVIAHHGADTTHNAHFDAVTMAIHWVTLLLVVTLFATAWAREGADNAQTAASLLTTHRSIGAILWVLTIVRLAWKRWLGEVPPLPKTVGRAQRFAARANEFALYALLLAQPVTGFLQSIYRGKAFPLSGFTVPEITPRDRALTHFFHDVHEQSAWLLLGLIALHALAALAHHFLLRDTVLRAMLPFTRGRKKI